MPKFAYGAGEPIDVSDENVPQFEAAGWSPVEADEKPAKAPKDSTPIQ